MRCTQQTNKHQVYWPEKLISTAPESPALQEASTKNTADGAFSCTEIGRALRWFNNLLKKKYIWPTHEVASSQMCHWNKFTWEIRNTEGGNIQHMVTPRRQLAVWSTECHIFHKLTLEYKVFLRFSWSLWRLFSASETPASPVPVGSHKEGGLWDKLHSTAQRAAGRVDVLTTVSRGSGLHLLLGLLVTEVTVAMGSWEWMKQYSHVYAVFGLAFLHVDFGPFKWSWI